ncbi:hypothetical protein IIO_06168 [Bacillus cereus VD115]|nr:hypothetical protein IIO_06242 [Bacillus cereus VD115]EJR52596.1 hypothetical protein IIO_06168 [Bacillus cereus VD115]
MEMGILNVRLVPCSQEEATHIRVVDEEAYDLTYGGIYIYLFDEDPAEETHYVITDNNQRFHDFECVTEIEYLKFLTK